ncbi:MAG: hypothetical protein RLZZ361_1354 [Cyanobacteriota bacterium]|jgi:predicted AAA+ superfamily ATPase
MWGPRQTGKSTLLKKTYPKSLYINLLNTQIYFKYISEPWLLREEILLALKNKKIDSSDPIIIDEIQKIPILLNEVHLMIEEHDLKFALCGSSCRKVKFGQANLLGGRAMKYELYGFNAYELQKRFDLIKMLNHGYLPKHYLSEYQEAKELQNFYLSEYLKEEIAAEALVRNLPVFSEFLRVSAFSDAEIVSYSNIARECGVSSNTIKEYFHILEDTLLGSFLPAYTFRPKRKVIQSPKFYYSDIGLVNILLKRNFIEPKSELFGKAFENWVYHELRTYNLYKKNFWDLSYWKLANSSAEVDFVINKMDCAIEAKATNKIKKDELHGLRELIKDQPCVKKRVVVSLVDTSRLTEDGIEILNYKDFVRQLWAGEIF